VQDPAVVSGLVTAGAGFLLEKKQLNGGKPLKELVGSGEANNPPADDRDFHIAFGKQTRGLASVDETKYIVSVRSIG
jgi:hypothetical protein